MTVAWAGLPVTDLAKTTKHKLKLRGGTPACEEALANDSSKAESQGFFSKMFKPKEIVFERFMTIETQQFASLPVEKQTQICALPPSVIVATPLLSFTAAFRAYCYRNLKDCAITMQQPAPNLAISKFVMVFNNSDTQSAIAQCWPQLVLKIQN